MNNLVHKKWANQLPKHIARCIFDDLNKLFGFLFCNFTRLRRLRAIPIKDFRQRCLQRIFVLSGDTTSKFIGFRPCETTDFLKKFNNVLLINENWKSDVGRYTICLSANNRLYHHPFMDAHRWMCQSLAHHLVVEPSVSGLAADSPLSKHLGFDHMPSHIFFLLSRLSRLALYAPTL